ncbi:CheA signal transduction histidine kinase [Chthoniobacter flavus Ellin428]|uniref:histidine kinase n=1 Tax=Chthoniobacter flavus Ellin428 TaxID=497964 RepID=B4DC60_9BACT|nr:response regulator [Chthoniobacter flavus]EDY15982.1 CheA signal transduction histidine kinase [Chthoniobacter flavus Ellin428]TCO83296.1 CheA signal transduction histidine kinase [Chthoniobacter flavus]
MSAKDEEFLQSLRETFAVEAHEHLEAISTGLLELEKSPLEADRKRLVETVFRAAHSLKGAARAVNFHDIELICQSLEETFAVWKRGVEVPSRETLDAVHHTLDTVTGLMMGPGQASPRPARPVPPMVSVVPVPSAASEVLPQEVSVALPPAESPTREKSAVTDTVRISVAKLDARLLEAEEMLMAKLAVSQRAADLRELVVRLETWTKEWAAVQPEVRTVRQALERPTGDSTGLTGARRLLEFVEWNHDYLRTLESKVTALWKATEQDRSMVGKLVDDLLEDSKKMLMLPLSTQSVFFSKMVRDLCRDQEKEADFVIRGEEVEMDKRILEEMKDPLVHILRNCIDHGIEQPAERQRRGKPARATITLAVSALDGNKIELLVSDDGAGIDAAKVRDAAVRRGLISLESADQLSEADAQALIFKSDISTSPIITHLSGRGLGLAIVREKTERLGGRVVVQSRLGEGTTFRIALPVTLATFRGTCVEADNRLFIFPTVSVERVTRFQAEEVRTVEGRETLSLNGRPVALVRLAEVLELPPPERPPEEPEWRPVVLLGSADQRIAFAVDAVREEQEVLVKQLGKPLSRVRNISGATILGSGRVVPVLNVADLLKSARRMAGVARPAVKGGRVTQAAVTAKSILVAEDSITSRMLLKGILEGAGYSVKTAVDGMEAFTLLRAERFDLVISDVEMPRLNGFDLTARIRADRKLAEMPVILVTALASREDRERGIDVGANAYLVKSSFDQSNLLETVRQLA